MEFYTKKDIQEMLQLGSKQVDALMQTDGFPSIRIGRDYRVEKSAFTEWVQSTKNIVLDYRGISRPRGEKIANE